MIILFINFSKNYYLNFKISFYFHFDLKHHSSINPFNLVYYYFMNVM